MFKRIKAFNDITQIHVNYTNDNSEWFYVNWDHVDDQTNMYQSTTISEVNGGLFIVIDKNTNVLKEFDYLIEEDDNFTWEMYAE